MSLLLVYIYSVYSEKNINFLRVNKIIILIFIFAALISSNTKSYALNEDYCPPLDKGIKLHRHQRFVLPFFTNAKFKIKPGISIPLNNFDSVSSSISFSLPISFTFKSKLDIVHELLDQYLNATSLTSGLTTGITSIATAITAILAALPAAGAAAGGGAAGGGTATTAAAPAAASQLLSANSANSSQNRTFSDPSILVANFSKLQSKSKLFKIIEATHPSLGKSCLLRAICEISQTPLMASHTGLIGEVIDMLLTIDADLITSTESNDFNEYLLAQRVGKNSFTKQAHQKLRNYKYDDECLTNYGIKCQFSLFNVLHLLPSN